MRVLVTGGLSGIGAAIGLAVSSRGDEKVTIDRTTVESAAEPDVVADLSYRGEADRAVREAAAAFGPPDAIVNCAGVYLARELRDFSWEYYEHCMSVNLVAPIEATLAWLDVRSADGRGVVINISSTGATSASVDLSYAASKAGLEGATRSLARSLAAHGIMVFGVAPGLTDTPMSRAMPQDRFSAHASRTLLGRAAAPGEIADVVAFLLTGKSDYMTGSIVNVSCGLIP